MTQARRFRVFITEFNEICKRIGRDPQDITILGASKRQHVRSIQNAFRFGVKNFGENFLQEAEQKISEIGHEPIWHFIGSIQTRKAKKIASIFDWVQTVDRIKVAQKLNENRPNALERLNICIQVNPDNEDTKSGIPLSECNNFMKEIVSLKRLKVRGLMSIPRLTSNFEQQRKVFGRIRSCFEDLKSNYPDLDTLSMGMSSDYEAALIEGSTMLRVGTNIFGQRD
tara:strand:- start:22655 stop:23332 length:678 start_codon:yes stop_codon:yes gene_type:complete